MKTAAGLDSSGKLGAARPADEVKKASKTRIYGNPDYAGRTYRSFMLAPVEIYSGTDNDFGDIPKDEIKMMADYTAQSFIEAMTKDNGYPLVTSPSADTLRVKFTLIGLSRTVRTATALTVLNPLGFAINTATSLSGGQGTFMGDVTLAGEFFDSATGTLVGAFQVKRYPMTLDVTSWLGEFDAAKSGIDEVMTVIRKRMDKANGR